MSEKKKVEEHNSPRGPGSPSIPKRGNQRTGTTEPESMENRSVLRLNRLRRSSGWCGTYRSETS